MATNSPTAAHALYSGQNNLRLLKQGDDLQVTLHKARADLPLKSDPVFALD